MQLGAPKFAATLEPIFCVLHDCKEVGVREREERKREKKERTPHHTENKKEMAEGHGVALLGNFWAH